ncbi:hypothetical protein JCGZ_03899 [Jatropha curcas]|uniref:Uncharacterized protein n=1 Tax=Jatropha curcas TaxID=180498 RepID=A0A067LF38_JATCU|nr:hypothetical protein JCGZ_03899 [Jatropha curcas]
MRARGDAESHRERMCVTEHAQLVVRGAIVFLQIAAMRARGDAESHRERMCVTEHAQLVVRGAIVFLQVKLRAFMPASMGGHVGITRADIFVAGSSGRDTIAPLAACIACPDAHLVP